MKDKLKAVKIIITYYGVGLTKQQAVADAWNDISNDRNYQIAKIEEQDCDVDEANFDSVYLDDLEAQGE